MSNHLERQQQWLVFFEMFLASLLANSLAPLVTSYQEQFQLSMAQASLFPVISTLGGVIANLLGTFFIAHIGLRRYNYIFLILMILTFIIFYYVHSVLLLFTALFMFGFSIATGMAVTSTLLSQLPLKYHNFGLYHAFFGLGGIITPGLIGLLLAKNIDYHNIYLLFLAVTVIAVIFLWKARLVPDYKFEKTGFIESLSIIKLRVVYLSLIILILYAGCEMGIVLWSGNLFSQAFHFSKESSALFLSGFWIIFTLGRIFTHQIEKFCGFFKTQYVFISLLLLGLALLLGARWPLAFFLIALGMAPIFPLTQKYAVSHIPKHQIGMFSGVLFGFLGLGNMFIPGAMGLLGNINIYYAFLLPIFLLSIILIVVFKLKKTARNVTESLVGEKLKT
ncbi:MAG: MFS transporter [Candidatus Cloacimonadales bacterium]|nr:MFS transporter [Candidatus Cloacimonadales bacterium]